VSPDKPEKNAKFKVKQDFPYRLLSDTEHTLAEAYAAWGDKTFMGRTFLGQERCTFLVDAEGVLRKVWRKVKVKGHVEDVLAAAKEL